jgi:DNA topoisomerase-1
MSPKKISPAPKAKHGKSLVIVESPAKVKTLSKIIGPKYQIEACYGHIRDLPPKRLGLNIKKDFKPTYEIIKRQIKLVNRLKKAARRADEVYLASDPDREGEAIAWHLTQALELELDKVRRVSFNELTEGAVRAAFQSPSKISLPKVNAQQARRFLDRLVGYKLSPLLWRKITRGLSAGRVQSVAVKLVVEREQEIRAFNPQEYWGILAQLNRTGSGQATFSAELQQLDEARVGSETDPQNAKIIIPNETEARSLVEQLQTAAWRVAEITQRVKIDEPPPPFTTSLLQQQASVRLGFSPKKTMFIAQQLYEGVDLPEGSTALITYMRTDAFRVSEEAIKQCRDFITDKYGANYLNETVRRYRSKKSAQEAHEAIRPTYLHFIPDEIRQHLTPDQYKLYSLIWSRFIATQMKPAEWLIITVKVEAQPPAAIQIKIAGPEKSEKTSFTAQKAYFTATAKKLIFPGYLKVTTQTLPNDESSEETTDGEEEKDAGAVLSDLRESDSLHLIELQPTQHFTKPPPRYTEASLVRTLERYDIGRPSTYAPIISTIQERGYVRKARGKLYASELGILVTGKLADFFKDIMNTDFTAQMENKLDLIEEAQADWLTLLKDFYRVFEQDLQRAQQEMTSEKGIAPAQEEKCDKCGAPMVIRWSKTGKFLACSKFPACKYLKSLPSTHADQPAYEPGTPEIKQACPKCGKPMVVKWGRRGRFLACSGYPDCKTTQSLPADSSSS